MAEFPHYIMSTEYVLSMEVDWITMNFYDGIR